jgi:actin related protein 2/3 complex subunit 3
MRERCSKGPGLLQTLGLLQRAHRAVGVTESWRAYFKQAREELGLRLLEKCYTVDTGLQNKYWMAFSNRKFLNKQL